MQQKSRVQSNFPRSHQHGKVISGSSHIHWGRRKSRSTEAIHFFIVAVELILCKASTYSVRWNYWPQRSHPDSRSSQGPFQRWEFGSNVRRTKLKRDLIVFGSVHPLLLLSLQSNIIPCRPFWQALTEQQWYLDVPKGASIQSWRMPEQTLCPMWWFRLVRFSKQLFIWTKLMWRLGEACTFIPTDPLLTSCSFISLVIFSPSQSFN